MGRVDRILVAVVAAMVFFVLIHQPLLALLAGLLGVIFLATGGDRYVAFPEVEVPKAGEYPRFDFWKDLTSDAGEFLGGLAKKFGRTELAVDKWSSWVKKKVYQEKSDTGIYMFGPYAMVLPNSFAEDMHKLSHISVYMNAIGYLDRLETSILNEMRRADEETRRALAEQLKKVKEAKEMIVEQMKEKAKKDED